MSQFVGKLQKISYSGGLDTTRKTRKFMYTKVRGSLMDRLPINTGTNNLPRPLEINRNLGEEVFLKTSNTQN